MEDFELHNDSIPSSGTGNQGESLSLPTDEEIHAGEFRAYLQAKGITSSSEIEATVLFTKHALRAIENSGKF